MPRQPSWWLLLVCAAGLGRAGADPACVNADSCEHNGICQRDGRCVCRDQWQGPSCGQLRLLPAPRTGGLRLEGFATWGGSVVRDEQGRYNMFASRIAGKNCSLWQHWSTNSQIVRAVANSSLGPFTVEQVVLDSFAHGPTIHKNSPAAGGGWLLFHIGCGRHNGTIRDCTGDEEHGRHDTAQAVGLNGAAPDGASHLGGQSYCNPDWMAVEHAPALTGPWRQHGPLVDASHWSQFGGGVTNPAPFVFGNGSVLLLYRGHKPEKLGASVAASFNGSYHSVGTVPLLEDPNEDPYIWEGPDGVLHGVTHWMGHAHGSRAGGRHIWSRDGIHWKVSTGLAYTTLLEWDDGTSEQLSARERPQLLVEDGLPKVLYNGVDSSGAGHTFTLAQPIYQGEQHTAWRLPPIDWQAGGVVGPTDQYAVRAFDMVYWPPEGRWYLYCDLVLFANPECPSSFGSEIGVFSADSLDAPWTYHGIAVHKNASLADAGGLATPTAIVSNGTVFVYFAYEGLPVGAGLRGIGGASAAHPLGPFRRMRPVAEAPAGWHRPRGPGGILDDPEVMLYGGRFHLFHSRKHVSDLNCSTGSEVVDHCVEWRTSDDGLSWERRGILRPPRVGPAMSETMSARVYGDRLVVMTDGKGMVAFTTAAAGLLGDDPAAMAWSEGEAVNAYAGLNGSFVNVALRVLPVDAAEPTHAALGWHVPSADRGGACHGGMTFAVFPLSKGQS